MPSSPTELTPFDPIDPGAAGMPLYRVVKRSLRLAVQQGTYPPGAALPSEADLASRFSVSVGTLRKAVDELVAEQLVVRRQGRGTFVARLTQARSRLQLLPLEAPDGTRPVPAVELLSFTRNRPSPSVARALLLDTGDSVIELSLLGTLHGTPVVTEHLSLPAARFKGMTEARARERLDALHELYQSDWGHTVVRGRQRIRAAAADRTTARLLELPPGAPVLQLVRVAVGMDDLPIEHRRATLSTARHELVHVLCGHPEEAP